MDFDSFLGLAEDIVNANDYIQIYNFKNCCASRMEKVFMVENFHIRQ